MIYLEIIFYLRVVWWKNFRVTCGSCRVQREEDKCLPIKWKKNENDKGKHKRVQDGNGIVILRIKY